MCANHISKYITLYVGRIASNIYKIYLQNALKVNTNFSCHCLYSESLKTFSVKSFVVMGAQFDNFSKKG